MTRITHDFLSRRKETLVLFGLSLLVLAVYWQASTFDFILLDDRNYIYENAAVIGGLNRDSVQWAFTTFHMANWHPLTWLSHLADSSAFGLNPGSHHATNVIFHLINTILAFWVFRTLTGCFWKSALVAALFAIHPAHVESVAWISERKDVLSTMFWLLTMFAYAKFAVAKAPDDPADDTQAGGPTVPKAGLKNAISSGYYWLTVLLFAIGLMAKPMLVTLPFVLILLDYWPLNRLTSPRDLVSLTVEKVPLFLLAAASSIMTVLAQKAGGAVQTLESIPFLTRVANAIIAYAKYLFVLIYPLDLGVYYPYEKSISIWQLALSLAVLLGVTALCIWKVKSKKYLVVGWLWYLGTLVPVIGLVQVGGQSMADRYTYVPYFGLFIIILWGSGEAFKKLNLSSPGIAVLGLSVVLVLSALSFRQVSYWRNDETLYRHTLAVTKNNYIPALNYCYALMLQDRLGEAEKQCRDSISFNPRFVESYISLGIVQLRQNQFEAAEASFRQALELAPNYYEIYINLATSQSLQGKTDAAETSLKKAASKIPFERESKMWINAINNLALAYDREGNSVKADEHFSRLLKLSPEMTKIRARYALSLFARKKYDDARGQIEIVLKQAPDQPEAHNLYGQILLEQGKRDDAAKAFRQALRLKPDFLDAKNNLKKTELGRR